MHEGGKFRKAGKFIEFLSAALKMPQTRHHRFSQRRVLLDRLGNEGEKFVFYQTLSNARGEKAGTLSELCVRAPMVLQRRTALPRVIELHMSYIIAAIVDRFSPNGLRPKVEALGVEREINK